MLPLPAPDARTWTDFAAALAFWAPVLWAVPVFGGRHLPAPARMALALVLAGFLDLRLLPGATAAGALPALEVFAAFAAGLAGALLLRLPFELARGVGGLAAASRGTPPRWTMASAGGERAAPLAVALELALLAGVGASALDHRLLRLAFALRATLSSGGPAPLEGLELSGLAALGAWFFATLAALALPFLLGTLLVDLALGILGRFLPQLPLFFLGQPLKALGILLLLAGTMGELLPRLHLALEQIAPLLGGPR